MQAAVLNPNGPVSPGSLRVVDDRLTFVSQSKPADFWAPYDQLWASDGTAAGTAPLLATGAVDAVDLDVSVVGGRLCFLVTPTGATSKELWSTDGTPAGTALVAAVAREPGGGAIGSPVGLGDGSLLASATDDYFSAEPWRFDDVWAPRVDAASVAPAGSAATVTFSEGVGATLAVGDFGLVNRTTGQAVPPGAVSLDYADATATATLTFPGFARGVLPDGDYRLTLAAGSVADAGGNALPADFTFDFFVLAGDANRDRAVNFDDLLVLAKNYNKTGATWAQGDFTGDGVVNFDDLLVLAKNYNKTLPATGAATAPASTIDVQALAAAMGIAVPTATTLTKPAPTKKPPVSPRPAPKPTPVIRAVAPTPVVVKPDAPSLLRDDDKAKPVFSITRVAKATPKPASAKPKAVAKPQGR